MNQDMEQIKTALQDVNIIKDIMQKSKIQLSILSSMFLWYGLLNFFGHMIIVTSSNIIISQGVLGWLKWLPILHYSIFAILAVVFLRYRRIVINFQNEYTLHLFDLWGFILFLIPLFQFIVWGVSGLLSLYNIEFGMRLFAQNDFGTITYISTMMGLLITGILLKNNLMKIASIALIVIYPIILMLLGNINLPAEVLTVLEILFLRKNCGVLLQMISLIVLGIYFKYQIGGVRNGDK